MYVDILGFMAGLLTTLSSLPQIIKSARTRSTRDLSLAYLGVVFAGVVMWTIYGALISSVPVMVWDGVSSASIVILIALKLKYK
jgi:MtN3 and saliva related transmembrane protein